MIWTRLQQTVQSQSTMTVESVSGVECLTDLDFQNTRQHTSKDLIQLEPCDFRNSAAFCHVLPYHTRCSDSQGTSHQGDIGVISRLSPIEIGTLTSPGALIGTGNRNRYNLKFLDWETIPSTSPMSTELIRNSTDTDSMQHTMSVDSTCDTIISWWAERPRPQCQEFSCSL